MGKATRQVDILLQVNVRWDGKATHLKYLFHLKPSCQSRAKYNESYEKLTFNQIVYMNESASWQERLRFFLTQMVRVRVLLAARCILAPNHVRFKPFGSSYEQEIG
jgi:hypothetical protein